MTSAKQSDGTTPTPNPTTDGITPERVYATIDKASKLQMIHAYRALITNRLWDVPDENLREGLRDFVVSFSPDEVFAALGGAGRRE